jgi:hypothetical protein
MTAKTTDDGGMAMIQASVSGSDVSVIISIQVAGKAVVPVPEETPEPETPDEPAPEPDDDDDTGSGSQTAETTGSAVTSPAAVEMPFIDVPEGTYFYDAVAWAYANGITDGTSEDKFSPYNDCTRAQVVTFLWRAAEKPETAASAADGQALTPFEDVIIDSYYEKAVAWAYENGITDGTSKDHFSPEKICTRAQVVTFLWRFEGYIKAQDNDNPFADVKNGSYYFDAVLWASENGMTDGTSASRFSPEVNCTRAQIVTFLYRNFVK